VEVPEAPLFAAEVTEVTEVTWYRGLPPKLAGMAGALSALPNDRMRISATATCRFNMF
jgi:hypothetical protein